MRQETAERISASASSLKRSVSNLGRSSSFRKSRAEQPVQQPRGDDDTRQDPDVNDPAETADIEEARPGVEFVEEDQGVSSAEAGEPPVRLSGQYAV